MKEKIKRISSSTWALILALMMVVSSFSVLAATTNVNKTGAYTGTIYYHNSSANNATVYIYSYGEGGDKNTTFGSWDTTEMNSLGDNYYSIDVPSSNTNNKVIFHIKDGAQTVNLDFPTISDENNMYYDDSD